MVPLVLADVKFTKFITDGYYVILVTVNGSEDTAIHVT